MKKHIKNAMEKVAEKKQLTFEVDEKEKPEEQQAKKKVMSRPIATYWVCEKGHVFKHKYRVHPDRLEQMKCPICNSKVKNKVTESTYLYYLKNEGRVDVGSYRKEKIRKEKQREEKSRKMRKMFDEDAERD